MNENKRKIAIFFYLSSMSITLYLLLAPVLVVSLYKRVNGLLIAINEKGTSEVKAEIFF